MKNRVIDKPVTKKQIIKDIDRCIHTIQRGSGVTLTRRNILQYLLWFEDGPKGRIENEIDSYMTPYEICDIEQALISYGII